MDLISRFSLAWNSFYSTWQGVDKPPSYFNPVYFSLSSVEEQRVARYQKFWQYYKGEHTKSLKVSPDRPDDNIILNYSKRLVNKSNNYLFGKPLTIDIEEYQNTEQEDYLTKIFETEEAQQAFFSELGLNGAVTGDYYIQIKIDNDGIPRPYNLNPSVVFPKFDAFDSNIISSYDIRFTVDENVWRIKHYPNDNETWSVEYQYQDEKLNQWITDTEKSYIWEYPFAMIIKGKNLPRPNSQFGYSDLEDADINDYINTASSNLNKVIRLFAHPLVWGRNFNLAGADLSQILIANDEKATLEALELARDLTSASDFISSLKTAYHEINSIPESDPEKLKIGAQSGFALNVLNNDLMLKTGIKRSLYGQAIKDFYSKAFFILGYPDTKVKLHWQNPLPIDLREQTDGHRFDLEAGLSSKKTLASLRGYDYEEETNRLAEEKQLASSIGDILLQQFERGINA